MDKVVKARDHYDKAWDALNKFPPSETGKANRAKIKAAAESARVLNSRVLALGLEGSKDAEAVTLLMKEAGPATGRWQASIDDNLAFQEANNQRQYEVSVTPNENARLVLIGSQAVTVMLAALLGWLIARSVTGPMQQATPAAEQVADGDLTAALHSNGKDENTQLLTALMHMKGKLARLVGGVRENAHGVATAAAQIAQGNQDLNQRTEEQAAALKETAASMEQLNATVKQNADNAKQANQLALSASTVAIQGGDVVSQVVITMKGINDSSKKIADIMSVIEGTAFQTNILALNAAVEAARAGEQGRGFVVVASEVRSLAGRSADAAKEIKGLITASVERVEQGTALVDQAGATMTEVVNSIRRARQAVATTPAGSHGASERRGPDRARNVTRPKFGGTALARAPASNASNASSSEAAPAKTG